MKYSMRINTCDMFKTMSFTSISHFHDYKKLIAFIFYRISVAGFFFLLFLVKVFWIPSVCDENSLKILISKFQIWIEWVSANQTNTQWFVLSNEILLEFNAKKKTFILKGLMWELSQQLSYLKSKWMRNRNIQRMCNWTNCVVVWKVWSWFWILCRLIWRLINLSATSSTHRNHAHTPQTSTQTIVRMVPLDGKTHLMHAHTSTHVYMPQHLAVSIGKIYRKRNG